MSTTWLLNHCLSPHLSFELGKCRFEKVSWGLKKHTCLELAACICGDAAAELDMQASSMHKPVRALACATFTYVH